MLTLCPIVPVFGLTVIVGIVTVKVCEALKFPFASVMLTVWLPAFAKGTMNDPKNEPFEFVPKLVGTV